MRAATLFVGLLVALYATYPALAIDVNINPEAPPGVGPAIEKILGWAAWVGIAVCAFVVIYGVVMLRNGDETGKRYIAVGLIGAVIIGNLNAILSAL